MHKPMCSWLRRGVWRMRVCCKSSTATGQEFCCTRALLSPSFVSLSDMLELFPLQLNQNLKFLLFRVDAGKAKDVVVAATGMEVDSESCCRGNHALLFLVTQLCSYSLTAPAPPPRPYTLHSFLERLLQKDIAPPEVFLLHACFMLQATHALYDCTPLSSFLSCSFCYGTASVFC